MATILSLIQLGVLGSTEISSCVHLHKNGKTCNRSDISLGDISMLSRGGHRGVNLEIHYCIQVSGCSICGKNNQQKIEAPPLWERLPIFFQKMVCVYAKIAKMA